jgi:rhodanese-related sulfurtransferase
MASDRLFARFAYCAAMLIVAPTAASALDVNISDSLPYVDVQHEGKTVRIQRIQNEHNTLTGGFAKTSRKCPPFCIHPMRVAPGVVTVGELELFDFLLTDVREGRGMLIDARAPAWHNKGTIPGSVNVPFTVLSGAADSAEFVKAATGFGGRRRGDGSWEFRDAKTLMLWCNGPWCDQSPRAIKGLLRAGYPPEKLRYYRGGMQMWQILGLTTVAPDR